MGNEIIEVLIIGFGWSGIVLSKYLKKHSISYRAIEKRESLGGIWFYSNDPETPTITKKTITSSSKFFTEMSDFPIPDEYGTFPTGENLHRYLQSYVEHFKLKCDFDHEFIECSKVNGIWVSKIKDNSGKIFEMQSYKVAFCCGQVGEANYPTNVFDNFTGKIIHSKELKFNGKHSENISNKNVLIYGGGETSSDVACECVYENSSKVVLAIPRGQWCVRRAANGKYALDETATYSRVYLTSPPTKINTLINTFYGLCGHNIKEWAIESDWQKRYTVKSSEYMNGVWNKDIIPKKDVKNIFDQYVTFSDDSVEKIDTVLLCTGYKPLTFTVNGTNFTPRDKIPDAYHNIFDLDDPSIIYIGYTRPTVGSIPYLIELQCAICVDTMLKNNLPSFEVRKERMMKIKKYYEDWFEHTNFRVNAVYIPKLLTDLNGEYPHILRMDEFDWWEKKIPLSLRMMLARNTESHYKFRKEYTLQNSLFMEYMFVISRFSLKPLEFLIKQTKNKFILIEHRIPNATELIFHMLNKFPVFMGIIIRCLEIFQNSTGLIATGIELIPDNFPWKGKSKHNISNTNIFDKIAVTCVLSFYPVLFYFFRFWGYGSPHSGWLLFSMNVIFLTNAMNIILFPRIQKSIFKMSALSFFNVIVFNFIYDCGFLIPNCILALNCVLLKMLKVGSNHWDGTLLKREI